MNTTDIYIVDEPLVSIIMNCYNGERFLREAIDSIYSQTYKNWEIIFWDNASTDSSGDIAQSYDSKLKYYRSTTTSKLGQARVLASHKADGEYLAFLDADDIWIDNKLTKQINQFTASEEPLGFVYGRSEIIFERNPCKNYIDREGEVLPKGDVFKELAKENFIVFSSVIVHKGKFFDCGGFPEHFKNSTDYWIFLILSKEFSVGVVDNVCCQYRMHSENLSAKQYVICATEAIETVSRFLPDHRASQGLRYHYVSLAVMYFKENRYAKAIQVLATKGGLLIFITRLYNKAKRAFKN